VCRFLIVVLVTAVGLATTFVSVAFAWNSDRWQSPSRNIVCRFWITEDASYTGPAVNTVMCMRRTDGLTLKVYRGAGINTGFALTPRYPPDLKNIPRHGSAPVLRYGEHWTTRGFRCDSDLDAGVESMRCRTLFGHGFWLSPKGYEVW
jgi:hypothetical protein